MAPSTAQRKGVGSGLIRLDPAYWQNCKSALRSGVLEI